ncbi:hypothetical protein SPSIL_040090 [Sporomusa silvacetica DSM 10669]|uniref:AB hydrolase-1 domain-containing protein n=1 Tax=Sporomusa silvacetica DSM 10669 TaxID=1123289 RepID=A0ABZ3IQ54_9FIRM|nr:alpha/beta fold hydrolase [Sporomusa silvacetica]OZC16314.1 alpha/beta hydrolase family protein [Sporomusa silvacetica DSM 10669]
MNLKPLKALSAAVLLLGIFSGSAFAAEKTGMQTQKPIVIQEQGAFSAGGSVITTPGTFDPTKIADPKGQTLHGDHASVFYQIPAKARKYPLVFLHGAGQSARTWQTTPDGREGFQNIFLRRNYSVYLIDQPRRGQAGRSTVAGTISATTDDQMWFDMFRLGEWPNFFSGVQFPKDDESLNQYFRQMTPNTAAYDSDVVSNALTAALDKIGPSILVTHSQGGGPGWLTAMKSKNVKAVVAYEPGSQFVFPEGEVPEDMPSGTGTLKGYPVPLKDFMQLTKMPIIVYYGDNIPTEISDNPGQDNWRVRLKMARIWADTINRHGGDATLVHLPEVGIYGNTHFMFSDLNNVQIADLLSKWLKDKGLD